jgi:hypothetical protein
MLASSAVAGQRTRGGDSVRGGHDSVAAPEIQEIAPGMVSRTVAGVVTIAQKQNIVNLEDVIRDYDSVEIWRAVQIFKDVDSVPSGSGDTVLSNGAIVALEGYSSSAPTPLTIESYKATHDHLDTVINGDDVTVFKNGAVTMDSDQRSPWQFRTGIPMVPNGGDFVHADGVTVLE